VCVRQQLSGVVKRDGVIDSSSSAVMSLLLRYQRLLLSHFILSHKSRDVADGASILGVTNSFFFMFFSFVFPLMLFVGQWKGHPVGGKTCSVNRKCA